MKPLNLALKILFIAALRLAAQPVEADASPPTTGQYFDEESGTAFAITYLPYVTAKTTKTGEFQSPRGSGTLYRTGAKDHFVYTSSKGEGCIGRYSVEITGFKLHFDKTRPGYKKCSKVGRTETFEMRANPYH